MTAWAAGACLLCALLAASARAVAPALSARAWIAWEPDLNDVVASRDADVELPMASTTKLMTALVTLEHEPRLSTRLPVVRYPTGQGQSTIGLQPGERLTVADLLRAMLLPSADEAAQTLAVDVGGSVPAFVAMMNAQASALGLAHTHYSTPVGLDTAGNYSTASDLVRLANYLLLHYSFIDEVVAEPSAELRSGAFPRRVQNLNDLVGRYSYVVGVKTGHTDGAGYVLVGEARAGRVRVLSAVMGDPSSTARDADTLTLLRSGLAAFGERTVLTAGQRLASTGERYRSGRVALVAARAVSVLLPRGERVTLKVEGVPSSVLGPARAGRREGTVLVRLDGRTVAHTALVLADSVAKATVGERLRNYLGRALTIVLLIGVIACSLLLVDLRRRATRRSVAGRTLELDDRQ
ncbi:MAG TPA: D-alanyl-D-alanine carboxypeptidase family protein [Solirubrobacteraceae bacterium]|nr:D-alanyl-D-alanine carboxypeptidase family protein [Solirubrobacteraceae bacterium]